jgi:PhzF family phenazine biosynthesis protein
MGIPLYQVDAFTHRPLAGNPAAVCLLSGPRKPGWMQQVAREMNLSETAFLHCEEDAWRLRWFTPTVEVALCGHATLASAHVLWETGRLRAGAMACFNTRSGRLTARQVGSGIELDFPAKVAEPADPPPLLSQALGVKPRFVGRSNLDYLVEVDRAATVRNLKPDFTRLAGLPVRGVIVTARSDQPEFDFISRFFAPAAGVNEDPVTGSAHCTLGPYWQDRLKKNHFTAFQASDRGGVVQVHVAAGRVFLGGRAVTILRGELVWDSSQEIPAAGHIRGARRRPQPRGGRTCPSPA